MKSRRCRTIAAYLGQNRKPTTTCSGEQTRIPESQPIPFRFVPASYQWLISVMESSADMFRNETLVCWPAIT